MWTSSIINSRLWTARVSDSKNVDFKPKNRHYLWPFFERVLYESDCKTVYLNTESSSWIMPLILSATVCASLSSFRALYPLTVIYTPPRLAVRVVPPPVRAACGKFQPEHKKLLTLPPKSDWHSHLIYYTCKKVTYELLTYEYNPVFDTFNKVKVLQVA